MSLNADSTMKDTHPDLSTPHEKFPGLGRICLYDRVTAMFLDVGDDAEIARELSEEFDSKITAGVVTGIRQEAAMTAENQKPEIRRKWSYRYKNLTVNNVVKEYMFIEGKHNFLKAKREFAEEIEALVQKTPTDKLWIAINDALGRNNISLEFVYELLAYGRTARKLEKLVRPYADAKLMTLDQGMMDVATRVRTYCDEGERDGAQRIRHVAKILDQNEKIITLEDAAFLVEYGRFAGDSMARDPSFINRVLHGADVFVKPPSVLDQLLLGDVSNHLSSAEIAQLVVTLRSNPVMKKTQLEQILSYARRHISGIEIMKELGRKNEKPEQVQVMVQKALESLQRVVEDHLSITDIASFLSNNDMASAAGQGVNVNILAAMLAELNQLPTFDAVVGKLSAPAKTRYAFPSDRYCKKRFGTPGPFKKN